MTQYGIYVHNTACVKYADAIVNGYKTIETRSKNVLKQLIGRDIAIIRTASGKKPVIIGYCRIAACRRCSENEFRKLFNNHCVPAGSKYDIKAGGYKYLYFLENCRPCRPQAVPENAKKHGRIFITYETGEK